MQERNVTLQVLLDDKNSFLPRGSEDVLLATLSGHDYNLAEFKPTDGTSLTKDDKQIVKMRLIVPVKVQCWEPVPCLLYIRYANGDRETLKVTPNKINAFYNLLYKKEFAYERNTEKALDWKDGIQPHYHQRTYKNYEMMGLSISNTIDSLLTNPEAIINLIDIGCGEGQFLINHIAKMPNINWIGIDLSDNNIRYAKEKTSKEQKDRFIVGNMLDINSIINRAIKEKKLDPDAPFVITSLGSITRMVLPNGFTAAQVLQELYKIENLHVVFGGGVNVPIITNHIAKRIGFKLAMNGPPYNMFSLEKLDGQEILTNKMNKIKKSQLLDLSLSPIPEKILKHKAILKEIHESKKPITIDVSYCQLNDTLLEVLLKIMNENKPGSIKLKYYDASPLQVTQFEKHFSQYVDHIDTYQAGESEDILLVAPKRFFDSATPQHRVVKQLKEIQSLSKQSDTKNMLPDMNKTIDLILTNIKENKISIDWLLNQAKRYDPVEKIIYSYVKLKKYEINLPINFHMLIWKSSYYEELVASFEMLASKHVPIPPEMLSYFLDGVLETHVRDARVLSKVWLHMVKQDVAPEEFFEALKENPLDRKGLRMLTLFKKGKKSISEYIKETHDFIIEYNKEDEIACSLYDKENQEDREHAKWENNKDSDVEGGLPVSPSTKRSGMG